MNLDEAVAKHAEWKVKFRSAMERHETMDHATICKDDACMLGKWLYSDGKSQFSAKPEFAFLVQKHKEFHAVAGRVAQLINERNYSEAEKELEFGTPYTLASNAVGSAIIKLKKVIQ